MFKKIFISLGVVLLLSFSNCGGGSSDKGKELLSKILQFIGIPHSIVVNVCQDNNLDGICGEKELFTKIIIKKGESLNNILEKISLTADGRYFLETYDPELPILVEFLDSKNIHYDNGHFTLKFNGFNKDQNETKEISAIQALEDAGYLTAEETRALRSVRNREVLDQVIFESLENNYNLLKGEKLTNNIARDKGLEVVASGLQQLDISQGLPASIASCEDNSNCITKILNSTSQELNISKEEAEVIADEVKIESRPKTQKNIADGYIAHLSSPVEAKCVDGSYSTTKVGLKGSILFDTALDEGCEITVPSSAIIDSNNNGQYDNGDKILGFSMRGLADGTFISPLTTLLRIKELKGEDVGIFKIMVKDFNPVSASSAVGLYTGNKKNQVQKLMLLMEILKVALKEGADISSIDLTQILSTISFSDIDLNQLLGGLSDSIKSKIMESLEANGFMDLLSILDKIDTSKVNLNTLVVNISDGGKGLNNAIRESLKVSLPTDRNLLDSVLKDNIELGEGFGLTSSTFEGNSSITGKVEDAIYKNPLENVNIKLYKDSSFVKEVNTDSLGIYLFSNLIGESGYSIEISKTDYLTVDYKNISLDENATEHLETILHIEKTYAGTGDISGKIIGSIDGIGRSGITINFRKGINRRTGDIVKTVTTRSGGVYNVSSLDAGSYTGELQANEYQTSYMTVIVLGGTTRENQNGTINPLLAEGEIRIVLTWGERPSDLDSHLTGPDERGSRFHIDFTSQGSINRSPYANLDIDDVSSYGPETVTIRRQQSGVYRYWVHDYSNGENSSSSGLSNSSATVKVYNGNSLPRVFHVPNQMGTVWKVFEIENGIIKPIDIVNNQRISTMEKPSK